MVKPLRGWARGVVFWRVLAMLILAGLTVYLVLVGVNTAGAVGSAIGAVAAVAALLAPYLIPSRSPASASMRDPVAVATPPAPASSSAPAAGLSAAVPLDLRGSNAPQINLTSGNTQNVTFGRPDDQQP